eukprot:500092-Pelagomonas_calceolata.AAC.10
MMVDTPGPAKRKNIRKANARKQVQPLENMLSYPCTGLLHMHALPVCMQVECAFNQIWVKMGNGVFLLLPGHSELGAAAWLAATPLWSSSRGVVFGPAGLA